MRLEEHPNPFQYKGEPQKIIPPKFDRRVTAQSGLFTIHPQPEKSDNDKSIDKIKVKKEARRKLKKTLSRYGVHKESVYPDLENLCSHLLWLSTDSH